MLSAHTDVEVKEVPADKSTDQTEAYVAQLQLQSPPLALYHFQRQFAGISLLFTLLRRDQHFLQFSHKLVWHAAAGDKKCPNTNFLKGMNLLLVCVAD